MSAGPVVAVLDPAFPFSLAAVHACADAAEAATVVVAMQRAWPASVISVLYPGRADHPAGKGRP